MSRYPNLPAPGPNVGLFPSDFHRKNRNTLWYAWLAFGISFTMLVFDFSPYLSLFIGLILFFKWVVDNVETSKLCWALLYFAADIFFREVGCSGEYKIPISGPVILACAPHSNQFVDGVVVASVCRRQDIGFVMAEVTLRRKIVGLLAGALNPIGVERVQDVAVAGPGTVRVRGQLVEGQDTMFSAEDHGKTLLIKGLNNARVTEIKSPTSVVLDHKLTADDAWSDIKTYSIAPSVDSAHFYTKAYARLEEGHMVAVFPEGGSHDRPKMIDLKPGIALIALGASAENRQTIPIIPVGLTYFSGHRFRSRAFVHIGDPVYVTDEQVRHFSSGSEGRRAEVSNLMKRIEDGLRYVTVQTDSYEDLQLFWALRRLYTSTKNNLSLEEKQALNKQFAKGYARVKDNPRVKNLVLAVTQYTTKLKECGLHDHMVANLDSLATQDWPSLYSTLLWTFVSRIIFLFISGLCWLPSGVIGLPFVFAVRYYSNRKAREACQKSAVKIRGRDLLATWKILLAIIFLPLLHGFYTFIVFWKFDHRWATLYFYVMPAICTINFKTEENIVRLIRSLRPLYMFIRGKGTAKQLVDMRETCVREVGACVDELGWITQDERESSGEEN